MRNLLFTVAMTPDGTIAAVMQLKEAAIMFIVGTGGEVLLLIHIDKRLLPFMEAQWTKQHIMLLVHR
jgi:hypothetical protein